MHIKFFSDVNAFKTPDYARGNWKRSFIPPVRLLLSTLIRYETEEFLQNAPEIGGIWNRRLLAFKWTENTLKMGLFENAAFLKWFPHNIRAIMAKIKLPKNRHGMVIFWIKVRRSYQDLSSQVDPARDNWTCYTHFTLNGRFALVENTAMKHSSEVWYYISQECCSEKFQLVFKKFTASRFLVIIFALIARTLSGIRLKFLRRGVNEKHFMRF